MPGWSPEGAKASRIFGPIYILADFCRDYSLIEACEPSGNGACITAASVLLGKWKADEDAEPPPNMSQFRLIKPPPMWLLSWHFQKGDRKGKEADRVVVEPLGSVWDCTMPCILVDCVDYPSGCAWHASKCDGCVGVR